MGLQISVLKKEDEELTIISLKGSLDTETHQEFKNRAEKELAKQPKGLIVDLEFLEYISSMGISALLEVHRQADAKGASFMLSKVPEHINQIFRIVKALPANIRLFTSIEEADEYFMGVQKRAKGQV